MILVEFTRDMRPTRAGDSRLLPDDIARRLIAEGHAKNPRDRFGKPLAEEDAAPAKGGYKTKAPKR